MQPSTTSPFEFGLATAGASTLTFSKKMKTKIAQISTIVFVMFHGMASGHQDTKLEFQEGRILGLPTQYSPATFNTKELELIIAGKRLIIPEEIRRVLLHDISPEPFVEPRTYKTIPSMYSFTASWYHAKVPGDLPPYIVINISPNNTECRFEILVDMDALKVIQADVSIKSIGTVPILLKEAATSKIQKDGEQAAPRNR
jgi:hypothetical protein